MEVTFPVSKKMVEQLKLTILEYREELIFKSVDSSGRFLGRVRVKLTNGYFNFYIEFFVLENLQQSVLIGLELIKKFRLNLNHKFKIYPTVRVYEKLIRKK